MDPFISFYLKIAYPYPVTAEHGKKDNVSLNLNYDQISRKIVLASGGSKHKKS